MVGELIMNEKNPIDANIEILMEEGFEVIARCRHGRCEVAVCRDEWVTTDLYRSVALPRVIGFTLEEAISRTTELVIGSSGYTRNPCT